MDVDKIIRYATALTVAIVTGIAAVESYHHITVVSHSPLLAFSIDGMIVASTLVSMAANRAKLETVWLAYVGLWFGIAATLVANVLYGLPGGIESAVWAVWPALCFVVTVETVSQWSRRKRKRKVVKPERVDTRNTATQVALANAGLPTPLTSKETDALADVVTRPRTPEITSVAPRTVGLININGKNIKPPMGLNKIAKTVNVGTPEARLIQAIMVRDTVDVYTAKKIRDREKHGA